MPCLWTYPTSTLRRKWMHISRSCLTNRGTCVQHTIQKWSRNYTNVWNAPTPQKNGAPLFDGLNSKANPSACIKGNLFPIYGRPDMSWNAVRMVLSCGIALVWDRVWTPDFSSGFELYCHHSVELWPDGKLLGESYYS